MCFSLQKNFTLSQVVMAHSLIPALGRQRLVDLCEFEACLVYRVSSRTGFKATQRNHILKKEKKITLK